MLVPFVSPFIKEVPFIISSSFFGIFRIVFRKIEDIMEIFSKSFFLLNTETNRSFPRWNERKVLRIFDISNCIIMETVSKVFGIFNQCI